MKKITILIILSFCVFLTQTAGSAEAAAAKTNITSSDIIYMLIIDRFSNGDPSNDGNSRKKDQMWYHGGDLRGIINKLDYLKDLGVTAIWINPVVENDSGIFNGYKAIDFRSVNHYYGDLATFKELVNTAHAKQMKIILDTVVNHTGLTHPWVLDEKTRTTYYHTEGNINDWNNQEEIENGKLTGLPDLNQDNPFVRKYLIETALWWIKETGVDGFRLDTVRHVPKDFWVDYTTAIKKEYPSFYLIGEAWNSDPGYINSYQECGISGMVDFPMYYAMNDFFTGKEDAERVADTINSCADTYDDRSLYGTFIDSHDVPRFMSAEVGMTDQMLMAALTLQMGYTGIPIIYYGTENAMPGRSDVDNRKDMDWTVQSPVKEYIKKLTALRKKEAALSSGDLTVLNAEGSFLAFSRSNDNDYLVVAVNASKNSESTQKITIPAERIKDNNALINALDSSDYFRIEKDGSVSIELDPQCGKIFKLGQKSSQAMFIIIIAAAVLVIVLGGIYMLTRRKRS